MKGIGKARINIKEMVAGSTGIFTIVFEAGEYGVDDSGEILIARRDVCDSDIPQFEDPVKPGYVKVYSSVDAIIKPQYIPERYKRPWKSCISLKVTDGSLKKGDQIYIQYGVEGNGFRIQTFTEEEHIFKVLVDCAGSGDFYEIDNSPVIKITGGYPDRIEAVVPSKVEKGKEFDMFLRVLDSWGNIAEKFSGEIVIKIGNNKRKVELKEGIGNFKSIILDEEGIYTAELICADCGIVGKSNPVQCVNGNEGLNLYWGDMHGQTKQTVGTGSLDEYFSFARDKAKIDFTAWQGNDFQVTDELWKQVNEKVKEHHKPGKFITFAGYEWSGTTPVGGDYNIYYLKDDQPIYRSYRWQIGMENSDGTDRSPISRLWDEFRNRDDIIAIPHVGGRYGNFDYYNPKLVPLIEVHSHHGTFDWFYEEAIKRGMKVGVIAGSDDHTCRPGLSFPTRVTSRGFVSFDVKGGYAGVYAGNLTRKGIWEALKRRNCYATTGERIIVEVKCGNKIMGDELLLEKYPVIDVFIAGTDKIKEVELKRGLDTIYSYAETLPREKETIRVEWSGVRVRSRAKTALWEGRITVENGWIKGFKQFAFDQPDQGIVKISNQILEFNSKTSGDIDFVDIEIGNIEDAAVAFCSSQISFKIRINELRRGDKVIDAGGVNQKVKVGFARQENKKEVAFSYEDKDIKKGLNTYWLKVIQKDGHMAWSSPIFITYNPDNKYISN